MTTDLIKLRPNPSAKFLSQCTPGELVKYAGKPDAICIAARVGERQRTTVIINLVPGQPATWKDFDDNEIQCVSFGSDYSIVIDPAGPAFPGNSYDSRPGVLRVVKEGVFLALDRNLVFAVATGEIIAASSSSVMELGKWHIHLSNVPDDAANIYSFNAASTSDSTGIAQRVA